MRAVAGGLARRLLRRPRVVYRAQGQPAAVALTFDDGPAEWTAGIARALEAHGCRGTFFCLGEAVSRRPEVVAALADAGHELGNHLWTHADPESQSTEAIRAEIDRTAEAIRGACGTSPVLVRPPFCGAPRRVARSAGRGRAGLVVLRSVDPADWSSDSGPEIAERVLSAVGPGDIVCMHDGIAPGNSGTESRSQTLEAVEQLVPALLERDLRPVTVSQLLR